ncbi:MAG TPA: hypothetical protein VFP22_03490, partial [Candidatus Limnocylindrales bacterium]|nr:hypothetical protein [Candidatus Limnocylindrales bacterium]
AGWFGAITAAAVLGFGPYPILRPISIILAVQVLDLPSRYLYMIQTIRGEPVGALGLPISVILRNLRSRL